MIGSAEQLPRRRFAQAIEMIALSDHARADTVVLGDGGGEPGTVVVDADGRISDVHFLRSGDETHVRHCLRSLVTSAPAIAPAPGKEVRLFHVFTRDP